MAEFPPQFEPSEPTVQPYAVGPGPPARTSGLAIASLVCGILGLAGCCALVPSVAGIVFGGLALPTINRGQARGHGMAVSGIITGSIGLLLGVGAWILFLATPETRPIKGAAVAASVADALKLNGILQKGEVIDYLCPTGFFSVAESGVIITEKRLVIYDGEGLVDSCDLVEIVAIQFDPAANWLDYGAFGVELENGSELFFWIGGEDGGDTIFARLLRRKVAEVRQAVGKSAPKSELSPLDEEDAHPPRPPNGAS